MKRREFLGTCAALGLAACTNPRAQPTLPPGELSGSGFAQGHLLRHEKGQESRALPSVSETRRIPVLIVGGGIAGLSAGWKFQRSGFDNFLIAELEDRMGGNTRYGENAISRYPLGAHYLPLPSPESRAVREMLADFGVLQGNPHAAHPRYDERFLCATPQERLYQRGSWHEGLMPAFINSTAERQQIGEFQRRIEGFKTWRDRQGRRAFSIPLEYSSRAPELLALDRITFAAWLRREGLECPSLRWYLNYTSRDDFGTGIDAVSAWAGLHYFACRDGEAENASGETVLTSPEGNGWIVRRLEERLHPQLLCGAMATKIRHSNNGRLVETDLFLPKENRSIRIEAEQLIWAGPLFVLRHVWPDAPEPVRLAAQEFDYAPWLVANLTLSEAPRTRSGAPLSWDNVLHDSPGLGYVVATHQQLRVRPGPMNITYYRAFDQAPSRTIRQKMLNATRENWADEIFDELSPPHPELREIATRFDVFRHGHAMVRPLPGLIWGNTRMHLSQSRQKLFGRIRLAHADLSGMSLFEEANYRGVAAAEQSMASLSVRFTSSLLPAKSS